MDRVDILVKELKELRQGRGLNDPELRFAPDDPLCVAFKIPKRVRDDRRQKRVKNSFSWWLEEIDEPRWRESLRVAFGFHPEHQENDLEDRRGSYAPSIPMSVRTVIRDEDKGIKWLAERLALEPKPFIPISAKRIYIAPNGDAYPLWIFRIMKWIFLFYVLFFVNYMAMKLGLFYVWICTPVSSCY